MAIFDAHAYLTQTPFSSAMATREAVQETMARQEITAVALISGLAASCDYVSGNRQLREIVDADAGLYGYVTLSVDHPEDSMQEQRRYLGKRAFVGSVLFSHDGHPVTLSDARDILNAQRRYAKPMAIHVSDSEAAHAAREIAAEFPTMKFVLLQMGGDDWHAAVAAAKQHLNIYLEISGSLDSDKVSHAAETLTARKLLYGSGLPHADPALTFGLLEEAVTLTSGDRRRVLFDNAQALFNAAHADFSDDDDSE